MLFLSKGGILTKNGIFGGSMRDLYIKQHIFSWSDRFSVYDEEGAPCYQVGGEVFSFGKKLHIYDTTGEELVFVSQKLLTFLPKYEISRNGTLVAEVVKKFTFFKQEYTVDALNWQVHGDFFAHEYTVMQGERRIAHVSREWFTLGDAYRIHFATEADETLVLAICLIIDACIEEARDD